MALVEDLGQYGDITTQAIAGKDHPAKGRIIAKAPGVISGLDVAIDVFYAVDAGITCQKQVSDGDVVEQMTPVLTFQGNGAGLLSAERTVLNFLGRLSGIATLTHEFVSRVEGTNAKILDTRKTTPGWRLLEKYAVICGGGMNHRMGLYDMFLLKENHISHAGGIPQAVEKCRQYMQKENIDALIEVETRNIQEFKSALDLNVDRIMLDNMSMDVIKQCVALNEKKIPLEISGNVNLDTVRGYADTGIDFISIGALTHSAKNLDLSMLLD